MKVATEDEMVDDITNSMDMSKLWQTSEGQGSLACCRPLARRELGTTEQMNKNHNTGH